MARALAVLLVFGIAGCQRADNGSYETEKPVMETGETARLELEKTEYRLWWLRDGVVVYAERGIRDGDTLKPVAGMLDPEGELQITEQTADWMLAADSPLYKEGMLSVFQRPQHGIVYPYIREFERSGYDVKTGPWKMTVWQAVDKDGKPMGPMFDAPDAIRVPDWQKEAMDPWYLTFGPGYVWFWRDDDHKVMSYEFVQDK